MDIYRTVGGYQGPMVSKAVGVLVSVMRTNSVGFSDLQIQLAALNGNMYVRAGPFNVHI